MRHTSLLLLSVTIASLAAGRDAAITVHPTEEVGRVNELIFGNNCLCYQHKDERFSFYGSGIWDPVKRKPVQEYVRLAQNAGITVSRWPGGCATHNYNWKKTVGPVEDRPDQQFGLPEYMTWCETIDAIPIISVAVYWGGPADAADLVEYLNAPNDGSNPHGGTDWGAVRAADGHPQPYHAIWFEYGNESYHGEHNPTGGREYKRCYSADEYARRYLEYRKAMKDVDADIRLGAVTNAHRDNWNRTVLEVAGDAMDFGIEHTYIPGFHGDTEPQNYRSILEACVACAPQIQQRYDEMNGVVEEVTGREDLRWAITEYNGHFAGQRKSPPFRQSLANALRNAEHLRVMMRPRNGIAIANFWQFANEYWGMVRGYVHKDEPVVKQANYYVYQLYQEHFGDTLVEASVECDDWDFAGAAGVKPRHGDPQQFRMYDENLLPDDYRWKLSDNPSVQQKTTDGIVKAQFNGKDTNYFHASVRLPAEPQTGYRVVGEIKPTNLKTARGATFQVGDARGWETTHSAVTGDEVKGTADWRRITVDYITLSDAEGIAITARRIGHDGGSDRISGTAQYRLVSVRRYQPHQFGSVPDVTVNAAKDKDGTISAMMVNSNFDHAVTAKVDITGASSAGPARAWSMVGPEPLADNVGGTRNVKLVETAVRRADDRWELTLPRHSFTALQIQAGAE